MEQGEERMIDLAVLAADYEQALASIPEPDDVAIPRERQKAILKRRVLTATREMLFSAHQQVLACDHRHAQVEREQNQERKRLAESERALTAIESALDSEHRSVECSLLRRRADLLKEQVRQTTATIVYLAERLTARRQELDAAQGRLAQAVADWRQLTG
jgi:predicted  nucleic acid-binding Zn-ribbon protein